MGEGMKKLAKRRIVFFNGSANGKTQLVDHVRIRLERKIKPLHSENFGIQLITDLRHFPRPDRVNITMLQRLILDAYHKDTWGNLVRCERNFSALLRELYEERTIPVIAIDNCEIFTRASYPVIKELNEYMIRDKKGEPVRAGVAFCIGGDVLKCKRMDWSFYEKCAEIAVDKLDSSSEIRDMLALVFPESLHLFKPHVIEKMKKCDTVQQMVKTADLIIDWIEENKAKKVEVSETTATHLVNRAKNIIEKLAA